MDTNQQANERFGLQSALAAIGMYLCTGYAIYARLEGSAGEARAWLGIAGATVALFYFMAVRIRIWRNHG